METLMASSSSTAAILCRQQRILPLPSSNSFFYTGCCSPATTPFIRKPLIGNHGAGRKLNHSFKHSSSSSSSSSSSVKMEIKCGVTEINESQFSEVVLKSDRPVLVEFIATWCGPCRLIAPAIESIAQEYEEKLLVVKIDHDSNPKLIEEYKVYGLPALILFKDGKEIPESRREGAITKAKLKDYVDALLKSACTVSSRTGFGILVHTHVLKCGLEADLYVQSSLIKFYANAKCLCSAKRLFDAYPERDIVCWNSMIDAYVKCGEMGLARVVFDEMPCKDVVSWNSMINGYGIIGSLGEAKKLFDEMPERNLVSWNSMLAGYVKCGSIEDALNMFRNMPRRDVVSWNAMLACYAQNGRSNETLAFFDEMKLVGIRANETTVVSVLSAIGQLGALDQGSHLHLYISEQGIKINSIVGTALIDMYVKCGNIAEASYIFNSMETKDILAWNTMLIGMGMHGHAKEAQDLFNQMQHEGVAPNDITFVAIFGAFRHAGMIEEGQKLLSSMKGVYGVEPKVEHYGCVIDLLSRAGRLDEALDLTRNMPMESNGYTWGALLGGCRIHGNANVAGEVGKRLLDLEPQHSGRYVLLSNIYAGEKRWDDARTTRKLMQANGVAKMPGLSVIELQEDVHSFMVGDHSHAE